MIPTVIATAEFQNAHRYRIKYTEDSKVNDIEFVRSQYSVENSEQNKTDELRCCFDHESPPDQSRCYGQFQNHVDISKLIGPYCNGSASLFVKSSRISKDDVA